MNRNQARTLVLIAAHRAASARDFEALRYAAETAVKLTQVEQLGRDLRGRFARRGVTNNHTLSLLAIAAPDAEFDLAFGSTTSGIGERRQVGRAIGNVHTIEQAVRHQLVGRHAEQRMRGRRNEFDGAVAPVAADHVAHIASEQSIAAFFRIEQTAACSPQHFRGECERTAIENQRTDAEPFEHRRKCCGDLR